MIKLLKIDFKKLKDYRTFWVLIILYFATMGLITSSGMEFLKWIVSKGADFNQVDILRIPLYHFPDIWQNLTYVSLYFQLVLAIVVIISITNEFSYKTVRQNIIDGMDRKDFLASKVMMIFVLSLASTLFVFLIGLITGSIYSPETEMRYIFTNIQ
jgi:ABC-2 type transport system permease protein